MWFARYESILLSPAQNVSALLEGLKGQLAFDADGAWGRGVSDGSEAATFVVGERRHPRVEPGGAAIEQVLTGGQLTLWRWLCELPEGWLTLDAPSGLCSQPKDALACAAEHYGRVGKPAPAPTVRGTFHLARHHYHEGGLPQLAKRAASEGLRLARRR